MGIRATPKAKSKGLLQDGRTTSRASCRQGMVCRFRVEQAFASMKAPGRMRQTMLRGTNKFGWELHLYRLAFNLKRMAKLCP